VKMSQLRFLGSLRGEDRGEIKQGSISRLDDNVDVGSSALCRSKVAARSSDPCQIPRPGVESAVSRDQASPVGTV
jgi:hypothetical protein